MPTTLFTVVVGSKLHGLDTPTSDTDIRGVFIHPLKNKLSPFQTVKNTSWIEGDVDNTSYELADFCKQAVHGNATILEVFFSNQILTTSSIADEMRENWRKFIDTDRMVMASRGYASNQLNKMQLFEDKGIKDQSRTPKFAVAYCRVLWQCAEYLRTGSFPCQITDPELKAMLIKVKSGWDDAYIPELTERFSALQAEVTEAWKTAEKLTPDIGWIEDFILRSYTQEVGASTTSTIRC